MSGRRDITLVAVDWGTSHLRVWAIGADNAVLAERRSDEGMGSTPRDRFEAILESHLEALAVSSDVPVIMCGMVGSRQGWAEAGYIPIPASLDRIAGRAVRVPGCMRDIRILPGLSKPVSDAPDVMRSEETQLLGLARRMSSSNGETAFVCMPGTHSKWVHMTGLCVEDFASFLTGDMYAALSGHSVLRHSLGSGAVDPESSDFADAVAASLDSPADILARLFSIRPAGLLQDLPGDAARARLSGYLIGQEIAGAKARFSLSGSIQLVGGGMLGDLYRAALKIACFETSDHDGDDLVIAGLMEAAAAIWNPRGFASSDRRAG